MKDDFVSMLSLPFDDAMKLRGIEASMRSDTYMSFHYKGNQIYEDHGLKARGTSDGAYELKTLVKRKQRGAELYSKDVYRDALA